MTATYTITGADSGRVFADNVSFEEAVKWVADYRGDGEPGRITGHGRDERPARELLAPLEAGEKWSSHKDARGIIVRRLS